MQHPNYLLAWLRVWKKWMQKPAVKFLPHSIAFSTGFFFLFISSLRSSLTANLLISFLLYNRASSSVSNSIPARCDELMKGSVLKPLPWIQRRSPGAGGLMRTEEPGTSIATPAVQAPCSSLPARSGLTPPGRSRDRCWCFSDRHGRNESGLGLVGSL